MALDLPNQIQSPGDGSRDTLNANAPAFGPVQQNSEGSGGAPEPSLPSTEGSAAAVSVPTLAATPFDSLSTALLAQQLPALPNFSGENVHTDGESFSEWIERLELVASVGWWNDQT